MGIVVFSWKFHFFMGKLLTVTFIVIYKIGKNSLIQLISYKQNGILHMLDRNRRIKAHPERFQETEEEFDLVVTVEERVYDQVIECEYPFAC